ncbi:uncharacterized protein K02A2.6-like [Clupea harengus]|uniref:Gypsy retrotransposon integrase-like protein 1 n=2 Tax=Clupea harengus TaxID=7950 RepID=A0A6P8FGC1_CLUHA|nr:uncharacterized protein K02A2.6-like [Clupea harengus]
MAGIIGSIGAFDELIEPWTAYTERFGYFVAANSIDEEKTVPTFLSVMGAKTFNLLRSLIQPDKPGDKTYDVIVQTLARHFSPQPLIIAERFRFHKRNQEEGESVNMFVATMKRLAEHCEFKESLSEVIRDRLVCGLRSEAIQKRLLTEKALTLDRAVEISVSKGHIERACKSKRITNNKREPQPPKRVWKKKGVYNVEYQNDSSGDSSSSDDRRVHILTIKGGSQGYSVTPLLEGQPTHMEIDTGAAVSIVSDRIYNKALKHLPLKKSNILLKTYTGETVPVSGIVEVGVKLNKQTATLPLYIVQGNYPSLCGRAWLEKMRFDWSTIFMISKAEPGLTTVLEKYAEVFKDELGSMKNIMTKLDLKSGSKPRFMKARAVPYALRPKVEAELKSLVESGVLEPVSVSEWATPIVPVIKKNGSIRICGDFKVTVNPVLEVEQYPLPLIEDLFAGLAGGKKFSKIDLSQAYLQMHVAEQSRKQLTINTHKGLYRYFRLPFGITSAPSLFQRAMDQVLSGLSGVQCYLDDILVTGKTEEEHLRNLEATLQRLKEYGLRVRKAKCEFFKSSVEYLGHVIDAQGLHKAPSKVRAITGAPAPQNVSQLRSYLGLLNYYGKFIPNLASMLKPLHQLLCQDKVWKWTAQCDQVFAQTKEALVKSEALIHFDPSLPLQLACDASPYGIGAVVSHILANGEERPIAFASRSLNKAESNYAQIEREALGIVFGIRKFHQYLFGRKFTLLTDHRPLTTIFGPHTGIPSLAASRMQRWALILSAHTYDIKYRKSELHSNADGLSRLPLPDTHVMSKQADIFYFQQVDGTPITCTQVKRQSRNDPVLSKMIDVVVSGRKVESLAELKPYLSRMNELSVQAGCLLWGQRVIIPPNLREALLQQLHSGHCGMVRMKELARSYFWWPGLDGHIEDRVKSCGSCQSVRNTPQLAPLHPWDWPEEAWQRIHIDFAGPFEERMLLVAIDAHSKWPEVAIMRSTTAQKTIEKLAEMFSRFGFPEQLVSDNGPQFVSADLAKFLERHGIQHIRSAPYHPATNGLAERFIQSMKHSLKASQGQGSLHQRLHAFLLSYRNVPHGTTKESPSTLLMKRRLRTSFDLLKPPKIKSVVWREQQAQIQRRQKTARDEVFCPGDPVMARNYTSGAKWVPGTIIAQTGPVSYTVQTAEDRVWKRHTDQLLQGTATPVLSSPGGCPQPVPQLPTEVPTTISVPAQIPQSATIALDPVSPMAESMSSPSTPVPLPGNPGVSSPKEVTVRRYPVREHRPPNRLKY